MDCRLWGRTESDMTEVTKQQQQQQTSGEVMLCASHILIFVFLSKYMLDMLRSNSLTHFWI